MNKLLLFGLLALLINSVAPLDCDDYGKLGIAINDLDEDHCAMLTPGDGYTHCCLFEINDRVNCSEITDDQYENIGRYIDYLEDHVGYEDVDIDCSSKFISLSLFAILALLF